MHDALLALLWATLEILFAKTGALLLRAASFWRWRAQPLRSAEHRVHAAAGAFSYRKDGVRVFTVQGQTVAGMLAWVLLLFVAFNLLNAA
jgi:hypothetical protein